MNKIGPAGGMGNEAIEIGFWHANQEAKNIPLQQIILIGDAPANTQNEVAAKRGRLGEKYWSTTKFNSPTYYKDEIAHLTQAGIPVHAFYVDEGAKKNFEEIAQETNGSCQFLDINSNEKGAAMLTDLITEEILMVVGKTKGVGDKFAKQYSEKFGKSYV
mgnify:FL=1